MIHPSTYQAAHAVASTVEHHFVQQLKAAQQRGEQGLAPAPPASVIEAMIDVAFWTSLRREEGHPPKISLAFLPPGQAGQSFLLEQRLTLNASTLTKLAPGIERAGIHLGVWYEQNELYVWGTTLTVPNYCFVLDVSEPGLLVIKYRRRHGFGKFVNVAVLIGDQIKVVDEQRVNFPERPSLLTSLLSFNGASSIPEESLPDEVNVLIQLAVSMRSHQHGGTLLIVPAESQTWRESIIHPIKYAVKPAFAGLAELMRQQKEERSQSQWQSALRNKVESMAGLTAVDGATLINDQYELLAFGAKIRSRQGSSPIERILMTEPLWIAGELSPTHLRVVGRGICQQHNSYRISLNPWHWSPLRMGALQFLAGLLLRRSYRPTALTVCCCKKAVLQVVRGYQCCQKNRLVDSMNK